MLVSQSPICKLVEVSEGSEEARGNLEPKIVWDLTSDYAFQAQQWDYKSGGWELGAARCINA